MSETTAPIVHYVTFEELLKKDGYLVYTNVGTSMMPLLRQRRDIIEIHRKNPASRCKRYDAVLYKCGDKYILHRVLKVRPKDYVICGDHNVRCEYGITDGQILGVMTRVIRDGKPIDTTDWGYRLYVHLWCDFLSCASGNPVCENVFQHGRESTEKGDWKREKVDLVQSACVN